jgi:hypothetical protein
MVASNRPRTRGKVVGATAGMGSSGMLAIPNQKP